MSGPNLFLVGPMGAGKSTVGRQLAGLRGMDFIDIDDEIEQRTGVDIPYVFEKEGEAGFRRRETSVIDELSQKENLVIATGGGAVTDPVNRDMLSARGLVIYLFATLDQQVQRTARSQNRPLLYNTDPREKLRQLFEVRDPLYREVADFVIESSSRAPRRTAAQIDRLLREAGHT